MEHSHFIEDQKIDLSDPNPQLTAFIHHYQAILDRVIDSAMASLILPSILLLTTNPGQESVYQQLLENNFKESSATSLKINEIMGEICDVWAACFVASHLNNRATRMLLMIQGNPQQIS